MAYFLKNIYKKKKNALKLQRVEFLNLNMFRKFQNYPLRNLEMGIVQL